jgi:hypothetical protein
MVHKTANRASGADIAVEIIPHGSDAETRMNIALKEVEKKKYSPGEIVKLMRAEGWDNFTMYSHTKFWQKLDAKNPTKGYGVVAVGTTWCWYPIWLDRVREECKQNSDKYKTHEVI